MFGRIFKRKRTAKINWLTVRCYKCIEGNAPYIMFVDKSEIKLRPSGYKGGFQAYICCTKCGKDVVIPNERLSADVYAYLKRKWTRQLEREEKVKKS